jgi:hypothetical protein
VLFPWRRYWFGTPLHLSTVSYKKSCQENKEYSVHLVGLELNMYVTKMYGTTNIKCTYIVAVRINEICHELASVVWNVGTCDGVECHCARSFCASGQRIVMVLRYVCPAA